MIPWIVDPVNFHGSRQTGSVPLVVQLEWSFREPGQCVSSSCRYETVHKGCCLDLG